MKPTVKAIEIAQSSGLDGQIARKWLYFMHIWYLVTTNVLWLPQVLIARKKWEEMSCDETGKRAWQHVTRCNRMWQSWRTLSDLIFFWSEFGVFDGETFRWASRGLLTGITATALAPRNEGDHVPQHLSKGSHHRRCLDGASQTGTTGWTTFTCNVVVPPWISMATW